MTVDTRLGSDSGASSAPLQRSSSIRARRVLLVLGGVLLLALCLVVCPVLQWVQSVTASYGKGNCEAVATLTSASEKPRFVQMVPLSSLAEQNAEECKVFLAAVERQDQSDWPGAYEEYLRYLESYPEGGLRARAREQAAESLLAWAKEESEAKQYEACAGHLNTLLHDFGDTSQSDSASELSDENYRAWAGWLLDQGKYDEAKKLADTNLDFKHAFLLAFPDKLYVLATPWVVPTVARPTSEASNIEMIKDAVRDMCFYERPSDDPRMAADQATVRAYPWALDIPGKAQGNYMLLSEDVLARTPETLHYAVCISVEDRQIEQCPWVGATFDRRVYYWTIKVRHIKTRTSVGETEIAGGTPGPCPGGRWLEIGGVALHSIYGDLPKPGDLDAWLRTLLSTAPP